MDDLVLAKILTAFAIFFVTGIGELVPYYLDQKGLAIKWLSILAALAAGVILGAGLCHIMPEASDSWDEYLTWDDSSSSSSSSGSGSSSSGDGGEEDEQFPYAGLISGLVLLTLSCIDHVFVRGGISPHSHSHAIPDLPAESREKLVEEKLHSDVQNSYQTDHFHDKEDPELERGTREQIAEAWIFFFALSLHSIFDGLSVGSEEDMNHFYATLAAVGGHKILDGFALGLTVFLGKLPLKQTAFAFVFCAAMTPLGVGIATATSTILKGKGAVLSKALMLSISAGSFIFISLLELLPGAMKDGHNLGFKYFMIFLGFGIMALLALWV